MHTLRPYLEAMAQRKASDLFITVGVPVTLKVDGAIDFYDDNKLSSADVNTLVSGLLNAEQMHTFEEKRECNFAFSETGLGRFRVNVFWQRDSKGMVLRRIETTIPDADDLQLPPIMKEMVLAKRGLFLFVGATGTGKSTSMASLVGYRNRNTRGHILTIEDPIEFVHKHEQCIVTQREVGIDTPSFESGLVNSLRQAPDVIQIGEVRTRETMEFAMSFSETGHLCIATLHANNANQALERMLHLYPKEKKDQLLFELSQNLKGIVAQQLVPRKDGHGRRAAVEVLVNTPYISELIRKDELHKIKEVMSRSKEQGMQTFDQALFDLYQQGEISYADALHHADSANDLRLLIKLSNTNPTGGSMLDNVMIDQS